MPYLEKEPLNYEYIKYMLGNNSYPSHFHRNLEFLYALDDGVEVIIDGKKLYLSKNSLLIIDSFSVHHIISTKNTVVLCIPNAFLADFFVFRKGKIFPNPIYDDEKGEIKALLRGFCGINGKNFLLKKSAVDGLLGMLIEKSPLIKRERETLGVAEKAVFFMNEHFKEPLDLETIARETGYSKFTLSHNFKKTTGMDIREYLSQIRVNEVIEEVEKEGVKLLNKKLIDYAFDAGFDSVQTFYRAFKRCTGTSPIGYFSQRK